MMWIRKILIVLYNAYVKLLETAFSKKFLVFIVCTLLLLYGFLPAEYYAGIALAVLGVETALDIRGGRRSFHDTSNEPPAVN